MKENNLYNKMKIILYIILGSGTLFSLLSIHFILDISVFAFPISIIFSAILFYFTFFKVLKEKNGKAILVVRKLCEYYPFVLFITFIMRRAGKNGTAFWFDVVTVILWTIVFVLSFVISVKLSDKYVLDFAADFKIKPEIDIGKKVHGLKKVGWETVGWIDALFQAIYVVLIIQIFTFQLYEIPSESMVPTFLVKDKVIVSKIECGPKFPLTDVGLPTFRNYKRGDTIVLRNPHYTLDRKSEVKTVTSQLIYMLTLMQVNLNRDTDGELKADPLVKRITGLPGEQLVMQDGVLYSRTQEHDFEPVKKDSEYAAWNLNNLKKDVKSKVQYIPLSSEKYQKMLDFEEKRRLYDLNAANFQAQEIVRKFEKLVLTDKVNGNFESPSLSEYTLFNNVQNLTAELLTKNGGMQWFSNFMTSWIPSISKNRDVYAESNFKLNVMTKITLGNLILRYAQLYTQDSIQNLWNSDPILAENYAMAEDLNWYIESLLDERNMPVFPANDSQGNAQFIPKNCYFMMGDNRFNSLDLRHSMESTLKPLTDSDSLSVEYHSMMSPQYINKKYIVGKPLFRFLPLDRLGKIE